MPLYVLAAGGVACAVLAAVIGLRERHEGAAWLRPFAETGPPAPMLHVAHVVVGLGVLEVIGRLENQTLPSALLSPSFRQLLLSHESSIRACSGLGRSVSVVPS